MKELKLTDGELQALIAPVLCKKLRAAGFKMGTASDEESSSFFFPINFNLTGNCYVFRDADGIWTIGQEDAVIHDRVSSAMRLHIAAINDAAAKHGT